MRKGIAIAAGLVLIAVAIALGVAPGIIESKQNRVLHLPPYSIPDADRKLFQDSVDLHTDSLLWGRNLLSRSSRGESDVPRLREAGAALQLFGVVTQSPEGQNIQRNAGEARDRITWLAMAGLWPPRTWHDLFERALYQAERLRAMEEKSKGGLVPILSRADLTGLLAQRAQGRRVIGAMLALEGSQALGGELNRLDALYAAGFRMLSPAHFVDTEIGGSAHGVSQGGLTPLGRNWVREMEAHKMIIDLAHASPRTVDDALTLATRPVVVSHTGVRGTCDNPRNLSDAQLLRLAKNGALIGIGYWDVATCGAGPGAIAHALRHAADVMGGVQNLALGSDFDGAVVTPFDASGVPLLAAALRAEKFTDDQIRAIAGGNALRFFSEQLP